MSSNLVCWYKPSLFFSIHCFEFPFSHCKITVTLASLLTHLTHEVLSCAVSDTLKLMAVLHVTWKKFDCMLRRFHRERLNLRAVDNSTEATAGKNVAPRGCEIPLHIDVWSVAHNSCPHAVTSQLTHCATVHPAAREGTNPIGITDPRLWCCCRKPRWKVLCRSCSGYLNYNFKWEPVHCFISNSLTAR